MKTTRGRVEADGVVVNLDIARRKFDKLRARYLAARAKREGYESDLRAKYSSIYETSWLSAADRQRLEAR